MNLGQNQTEDNLAPKATPELGIIINKLDSLMMRYNEINSLIAEKLDSIKGFEKNLINNDSSIDRGNSALGKIQSLLDVFELENDRAYANLEHLRSII